MSSRIDLQMGRVQDPDNLEVRNGPLNMPGGGRSSEKNGCCCTGKIWVYILEKVSILFYFFKCPHYTDNSNLIIVDVPLNKRVLHSP